MNRLYPIINSIIVSLTVCSLCQCSENNAYSVQNVGVTSSDSLKLQCVDTITLNIGNRIRPIPSSSQIIEADSIVKYVIMDENMLNVFDLSNDSLIANIDLKECGGLYDYSGFTFLNKDTIFAYSYYSKSCMLTDTNGKVLNSQVIPKELIKTVSPEALSCTPALTFCDRVILSGKPISHSSVSKDEPISLYWDYKNHSIIPGAAYSDEYSKGYFGGIYFNTIYQCKVDSNLITYSFPVSNHIYRYNTNLEFVDSIYMGSRYTKSIVSKNGVVKDFLSDKDERLNYYLEQDSYGPIFYNDKVNLYYRIAEHPLITTDAEKQRKPFSIIAMNDDGHLITETPVLNNDRTLITANAHSYKDGIIIQLESEDENLIKFVYYKIL